MVIKARMATARCLLLCAVLFTVCCIQVHCRAVRQADNSTLYVHGNLRTVDKDLLSDDDLDEYQPNEAYDEHDVDVPPHRNKHKKEHEHRHKKEHNHEHHLKPKHEHKHKHKHRQEHHHIRPLPYPLGTNWWETFIQTLIKKCYRQSGERVQFGVLYMGNIRRDKTHHLRFEPHKDNSNDPIIDPNHAFSPPKHAFNNYIVSRPSRIKGENEFVHSEDIVLYERKDLWSAYEKKNGHHPNMVVLYSWFMPCPKCTNLIISRFNEPPFDKVPHKVVAYTAEGTNSNMHYMTPKGNDHSTQLMRDSNILVWHEYIKRPGTGLDPDFDPKYRMDFNMTGLMLDQMANSLSKQETPAAA